MQELEQVIKALREEVSAGMLTYAHVCSRMLTYAHVCSRMLDVCWRVLTYAGVCWRMLTYAIGAQGGGVSTYARVC